MKFIKPVAEDITSPTVNIINSSIAKEIFPDSWKVASVYPVPKIDNPNESEEFPTHFNITSITKNIRKKSLLNNYLTIYSGISIKRPPFVPKKSVCFMEMSAETQLFSKI